MARLDARLDQYACWAAITSRTERSASHCRLAFPRVLSRLDQPPRSDPGRKAGHHRAVRALSVGHHNPSAPGHRVALSHRVQQACSSGHRVIATAGEGVAAYDAPRGQQPAMEQAVATDGHVAVGRTGRLVRTARAQAPGDMALVETDESESRSAHG